MLKDVSQAAHINGPWLRLKGAIKATVAGGTVAQDRDASAQVGSAFL